MKQDLTVLYYLLSNGWGKGYANDLTKVFIGRSSKIGKNLVIECDSNQEISKHIALKNDFEFLGESYGCSVFKRKLVC